ncbi:MAG: hypothetical protein O3C63_02335 [Cyanobacteria bacterium]|nr:hypothetical protein [Cyanobacteriota bacterium]MDA1020419.1 hypothetical protein [Cyanobacteriota bacterium]
MLGETQGNLQQNAAPQPPAKDFAFTGAKRAVNSVFKHLKNLNLDQLATQIRHEVGDARDADSFTKNPEKLVEANDTKHLDKAKDIKKNNELAAQKLEQALNSLSPVTFKFAFSVLMNRFPEVFDKYVSASQRQQQNQQAGDAKSNFKKASIIARSQDLGPVAQNLIKNKLEEDDKKTETDQMTASEKSELEAILAFFPGDGAKIDIAALVTYYKDHHQELPKDIRNFFNKNLQKAITSASEAKNSFENASNQPDFEKLPNEYVGKPGERAWLNKLVTASDKVGEYYNYTVDEAMETFNPQPWQPEFEVSYPLVTLVRGYRPGFEASDAKYFMTPTQGFVNQALSQQVTSPRFMTLEGADPGQRMS